MSKFFEALINYVESNNPEVMDVKLYSLRQVIELMTKARAMERAQIEKESKGFEGVILKDSDNPYMRVIKGRTPEPFTPQRYKLKPAKSVKGSAEEVFGARPVKNQWNDSEAICKENVENAVVILLNRGYQTCTVRNIVAIIQQFVPAAFDKNRKMIDYRHKLTKKFLSSDKKLLGKYGSVMDQRSYIFTIA